MYVCMYVYMYVCNLLHAAVELVQDSDKRNLNAGMCVCMYVCKYICVYVCMYVYMQLAPGYR